MEQTQEMSEYTSTFFQKLMQETEDAENRAAEANDSQISSIIDFQKTYEVIIFTSLQVSCLTCVLVPIYNWRVLCRLSQNLIQRNL